MMHRLDPQLTALDSELETCDNEDDMKTIKEQIGARESDCHRREAEDRKSIVRNWQAGIDGYMTK